MTARSPVLTFHRHGLCSEVGKLGECTVGYIIPRAGRAPGMTWSICLTDWPRHSGPAGSFEHARELIADQVNEWLARAGIIDPGAAVTMRVDVVGRRRV